MSVSVARNLRRCGKTPATALTDAGAKLPLAQAPSLTHVCPP